jgi:beta-fructofuranosidase
MKRKKTVLYYNKALELFKINRNDAGAGGDGERECPILPADKMKLQIFLDRSLVEIFINDGEKVLTSRIYPRADSTNIVFVPKKGAFKIDSLKFYELGIGLPQP